MMKWITLSRAWRFAAFAFALSVVFAACQAEPPPQSCTRPGNDGCFPDPSAKPTSAFAPTSVQALVSHEVAKGALVATEMMLLPDTAIKTWSEGDQERFYFLAVAPDDEYEQKLAEMQKELEALSPECANWTTVPPDKDIFEKWSRRVGALQSLLQDHRPPADRSVVVELMDFEPGKLEMNWQTVSLDFESMYRFSNSCSSLEEDSITTCIENAKAALSKLGGMDPPMLSNPLPELPWELGIKSGNLRTMFRNVVTDYNFEVERRRSFRIGEAPTLLKKLQRVLGAKKGVTRTIFGTVMPVPDLVTRTNSKSEIGTVNACVLESGAGGGSFFKSYYRTVQYCFESTPLGAEVRIDGATVGTTPFCTGELKIGSKIKLEVSMTGHLKVVVARHKVRSAGAHTREVNCYLPKKSDAPPVAGPQCDFEGD